MYMFVHCCADVYSCTCVLFHVLYLCLYLCAHLCVCVCILCMCVFVHACANVPTWQCLVTQELDTGKFRGSGEGS